MAILLNDSNDKAVFIEEGESANIVVQFTFAGVAIIKTDIMTLLATLYDFKTNIIINDRENQDVFDDNDGIIANDGTLTLRLGPLDNVIVGSTAPGGKEDHVLKFKWTWADGVETRTGVEEILIKIMNLAVPIVPLV